MLRSLIRTKAVPVLVLVLSVAAIGAITLLQQGAGAGRDAQLRLAQLQTALTELQSAPFRSSARTGGSPELARKQMDGNKREVARTLAVLRRRSPVPALRRDSRPLRANYAMLDEIYAIGASGGDFGPRADRLSGLAAVQMGSVTGALAKASREYDQRASTSDTRATAGSVAAIVLLVLAFMALYRRSARARSVAERLARENERLEAANREEARTDALTALGNRRALLDDVASELPARPATSASSRSRSSTSTASSSTTTPSAIPPATPCSPGSARDCGDAVTGRAPTAWAATSSAWSPRVEAGERRRARAPRPARR